MDVPQWVESWGEGYSIQAGAEEWIRERPESVRLLMYMFPPSCVVQVIAHTACQHAHKGQYGIVSVYYESGEIGFRLSPDADTVHVALPSSLQLVKCYGNATPDTVRRICRC